MKWLRPVSWFYYSSESCPFLAASLLLLFYEQGGGVCMQVQRVRDLRERGKKFRRMSEKDEIDEGLWR